MEPPITNSADQAIADLQSQLNSQGQLNQQAPSYIQPVTTFGADPAPQPSQTQINPDDLLRDPFAAPPTPIQEDPSIRLARLEAENNILRQYAQPQAPQAPQPDRMVEIDSEINRLSAQLPDPKSTDPNEQARRYVIGQDIINLKVEKQGLIQQSQMAMYEQQQSMMVLNNYKNQAMQIDPNFRDPAFVQAFDKFVETQIPTHLRTNQQVLDLARSKVGYAYLQHKQSTQQNNVRNPLQQQAYTPNGKAYIQQQQAAQPQLTPQEQNLYAAYGMTTQDLARYGSPNDESYDLGVMKYSHRRG